MIKHVAQRVAVLVDAQNMYHSAKHIHNARLNFGKAVEYAVGDRPLVRAIAYVAKSKTGEEEAFFEALIEAKIEPRIKDVQEYSSGVKKADWDVGMAIDAVMLSEKVDVIILMSGDGDFIPLVHYLHGRGVIVEVAAFSESTNTAFRECVDGFLNLSDEKSFLIKSSRPKGKMKSSSAPDRKRSVKVSY
ncbi:MAG: NYN domain-containing protein [bacterium]|nr:NYN domain-containing protein [bacterium]